MTPAPVIVWRRTRPGWWECWSAGLSLELWDYGWAVVSQGQGIVGKAPTLAEAKRLAEAHHRETWAEAERRAEADARFVRELEEEEQAYDGL